MMSVAPLPFSLGATLLSFCLSVDISNGELLRFLSLEILEVQLDFAHVLLHISRRDDDLGTLDELFLVIHSVEEDRDASLQGNEVETLLPFRIERTGALWRDAEAEGISLAGSLGKIIGHARMLASPHWHTAQLPEDGTQRPEEPLLLHQEVALDALSSGEEQAYDEIPVAGVGSQANDKLLGMAYGYILLPSQVFV